MMKTLKLKAAFFGFLAVMMASIILTSCGQEELAEVMPTTTELQVGESFVLPYGYDELPESEQNAYRASLTEEKLAELVTCSNILDYFRSLNKVHLIEANVKFGDILDESTLETYLTEEEVRNFQSFSAAEYIELEERGCSSWEYNGQEYRTMVCVLFACTCKKADVQVRDCWGWDFWRNRTRYVNWKEYDC